MIQVKTTEHQECTLFNLLQRVYNSTSMNDQEKNFSLQHQYNFMQTGLENTVREISIEGFLVDPIPNSPN